MFVFLGVPVVLSALAAWRCVGFASMFCRVCACVRGDVTCTTPCSLVCNLQGLANGALVVGFFLSL